MTSFPPTALPSGFSEAERPIAAAIAAKTGILPQITVSFGPTEHVEPGGFQVLRFWIRDRDSGAYVARDIDLRDFPPRENVKQALHVAVRSVRLDHVGKPFTVLDRPLPSPSSLPQRNDRMPLDEILTEMRRGCCTAHKVATEGCTTCAPTMRAIEAVKQMAADLDEARAKAEEP